MADTKRSFHKLDESLLANMDPFREIDPRDLPTILETATVRRLSPGQTLYEEDAAFDAFYLLLDGFVRLLRTTKDGEQVVFHHVAPGAFFGIPMVLDGTQYSVTAKAASEGIALAWPADLWRAVIDANPSLARATRQMAGTRMGELREKIVEIATRPVEQRIALAVLRLSREAGRDTDAGTEIDFPVTRQDISELTGSNMHSVSRCMSAWQKDGIILSGRRRVVVKRPDALAEVAYPEVA